MIVVIKKIRKLTYNFKYIVQIQKWEWKNTITIKVNIEEHKTRINITIKRLKKYIDFTFLIQT